MDIIVIMVTIIQNLRNKIYILDKLFIFLFLIICITGCGKRADSQNPEMLHTSEIITETTDSDKPMHRTEITLDGKKYTYNDHLTNMIVVGVDNSESLNPSVESQNAGQADSIYLVSFDRVTGKTNVISIPRDTITTVDVFDRDGTPLGPSTLQISLSYAFGDGKHESCRNVKEAVSRLFYRLPIQGYCALTLDSMEKICDILGTITVTIPNDSLTNIYPEMYKGAVVDITTENVETFLRYRDTSVSHSALERSERHHAFLKACEEQFLFDFYNDLEKVADFYTEFEPYMITNISADQFVSAFEKLDQNSPINSFTIPGEAVATDKYDEFRIDEDALYEQIIYIFFNEVTNE